MKKILLVILLLLPRPSLAAFTRVQTCGTVSLSSAPTCGMAVTAGHLMVVHTAAYMSTVTNVAGGCSGAYVQAANSQQFWSVGGDYIDTWYCLNTSAGTATITPTTASANWYVIAREYSFTGGALAFDVANHADDGGVADINTAISLTTGHANDLLSSMALCSAGSAFAQPATWTDFVQLNVAYNDLSANLVDAGAVGSKSASYTCGGGSAGYWGETMAAFTDGGSGGGGAPPPPALTVLGVGR